MNQQDIVEIRVLDQKTGRQIDKVYITKAQMEERGMPPDTALYAVPVEGKERKNFDHLPSNSPPPRCQNSITKSN